MSRRALGCSAILAFTENRLPHEPAGHIEESAGLRKTILGDAQEELLGRGAGYEQR